MKDASGNPVAKVIGGPYDGDEFYSGWVDEWPPPADGGPYTFVPIKTTHGRPRYRFERAAGRPDGEDAWVFDGWEPVDG